MEKGTIAVFVVLLYAKREHEHGECDVIQICEGCGINYGGLHVTHREYHL